MRFQTSFEQFSQAVNGQIFAVCLVGIRVLIGLACLYAAVNLLGPAGSDPDAVFVAKFFIPAFLVVGLSFTLGIFVRPVAVLAIIWLVFNIITNLGGSTTEELLTNLARQAGTILLLGLFVAGGGGHIFGLDGLIYRNLRRPNALTKFLFG